MTRQMLTSKDLNDAFRQVEEVLEAKVNKDGGAAYVSSHEILGHITETVTLYANEVQQNSNIKYRVDELISLAAICICGAASIQSESVDG